ncbi:MAG: hypothetical protein COA78_29760 [Blastopirellula sp.]|nr:MAG: hypothetical protein COA78_29760 [Blastopirellula sp.]
MPDAPLDSLTGDSPESNNPRKFSLIDLFALVTLAGLLSAMAAPYLRELPAEKHGILLLEIFLQVTMLGVSLAYAVHSRKKVLVQSGKKVGYAFCGQIRWQHWPVIKSCLFMSLIALLQLAFAMFIVLAPSNTIHFSNLLIYHIQIGGFVGFAYARYLWRVYPSSIEFFENGIALGGTRFIPWANVTLRNSQFFEDRIAVVYRIQQAGDTKMAQVSDEFRVELFAVAEECSQKN